MNKLLNIFNQDLSYYNNLTTDNKLYLEGLKEVNEVNDLLIRLGIKDKTKLTPSLARGLSIYTGTVFEFFDNEQRLTCSLGGGGRYNKIITEFIDDGNTYPAVGLSFGLEPIFTIIKDMYHTDNLLDIYIIPMDTEPEAILLAEDLRNLSLNVMIEFNKRKVKKCFEYANKEQIKYVIVLGENEVTTGIYTLKNMTTGEQLSLTKKELLSYFEK